METLNETAMTDFLLTCDRATTEAAIVALNNTKIPNLGFDETDIVFGTYLMTWIKNGKHLSGIFLLKGRLLTIKYRLQLIDIAREKAARKALKQEAARNAVQKPIGGNE